MTSNRAHQRAPVSLRKMFPESQIFGAGDILADRCLSEARLCRTGDVFVADSKTLDDITSNTDLAIANGAAAIITEEFLPVRVPQLVVDDIRTVRAQLCHELANRPCEHLLTVGVLGTHGKTTMSLLTATMLKRVCGAAAYRTSLGASDGVDHDLPGTPNATPEELTQWLTKTVERRTPAAVLEASREILTQRSAAGLQFDLLMIPSLRPSQSGSQLANRGFEDSVLRTMSQLKDHGLLIYNADDARLNRWVKKHRLPGLGYGLDADSEVRATRLQRQVGEQTLMVSAGRCVMPMTSPLVGDHNARHLLAAVAAGYAFGLDLFEVVGSVERLTRVPGRMQPIHAGQSFSVYIDAADQPDRLAVALHALAATGPVTCIAEAPTLLSAQTRQDFGRVLERSAHKVILTHSRAPGRSGRSAVWEVLDGCERPAGVSIIPNRQTAMDLAFRNAAPGEQILLAGCGNSSWKSARRLDSLTDASMAQKLLSSLPSTSPAETAMVGPSLKIYRGE